MDNLLQRILALVLALSLCLSASPALAAEVAASASTVQLNKTEGAVAVTNSAGRALTQLADMRLYSGNHVATEAESYAWLMLDSTKLNKLDAVSEIELRKKDKKLEVLLDKGNLYFNVTKPLEDQETLSIRTSTMVVGIRGTSGWVKVVDEHNTLVYILEGTVWCTVTDPLSGQSKTTALSGGETARFTVYDQAREGDRCDIALERFTETEIDGFVLAELLGDGPMCEKIYTDSGLDLRNLTEEQVRERLERDQAETAGKLREQEELENSQERNISRDPVWTMADDPGTEPRSPGGGNSSGGGSTAPAPAPEPTPTPTPTPTPGPSDVVRLTMPVTDMEVQQALNLPAVRQVVVSPGADPARNTLEIGIGMDVAAGKTLTLEEGVPAQVLGGLNVDGTADLRDSLENTAGTVTVNSANTLRVGGDLTNRSVLRVTAAGRAVVEGAFSSTGSLELTQGARVLARGFALNPGAEGWSVSEAANGEGYYTLDYTGTATPPAPPEPEPVTELGDFKVTSTGEEYAYADHVLTITGATPVTISMADGVAQTTTDSIFVADGVSADITLDGVKIDQSGGGAAFQIADGSGGDVNVTLIGNNVLKSGIDCAGLQKTGGSDSGTLTIQGSGALEAVGGEGAGGAEDDGYIGAPGIGAQKLDVCANIVIAGNPQLTVTGGYPECGLGGEKGMCYSLEVSGGTINGSASVGNGDFTMTGGTINGDITSVQSNFTMTGGTINGTLTASTLGEVYLNGGEIVSDRNYTISASSSGTYLPIYVNGGTVTNTNPGGTAILLGSELNYTSGSIRGMNVNLLDRMDGFKAVRQSDGYYCLAPDTGDFTVTGGIYGRDYKYGGNILKISTDTPLTVSTDGTTTRDTIQIADGVSANLTLAGVGVSSASRAPLEVADGSAGNVTITLSGENGLDTTAAGMAALQKKGGSGSLTINGDGRLSVSGGFNAPGIGSGDSGSYPISIQGGCYILAETKAGNALQMCIGAGREYRDTSGWQGVVSRASWPIGTETERIKSFTVYGQVTLAGGPLDVSGYPILLASEDAWLRGGSEDFLANLPAGWKVEQREDGYWYLEESASGTFSITGGDAGRDYDFDETTRTLKILTSTPMTISNGTDTVTDNTIRVEDNVAANVTLDGVHIDVSSEERKAAFEIAEDSPQDVNLTLVGENTLTSGNWCAGLQKNGGTSTGTLTIGGTGTLTAAGGIAGAGIGGGYARSGGGYCDGSNITINSGTIIATGGTSNGGAGIGGARNGDGLYITINGGDVTANGGDKAAGIGGGGPNAYGGSGRNITITGGTVRATGSGYGAGIGGGYADDGQQPGEGGEASDIVIDGGTVIATGLVGIGASISTIACKAATNIIINDGTVTAYGGIGSVGSSSISNAACSIEIHGGIVEVENRGYISGGIQGGPGTTITVTGGKITATNTGSGGAAIGLNNSSPKEDVTISITGGIVRATSLKTTDIGGGGSDADYTETAGWRGIVFRGKLKTATVYGNVELTEELEIPDGYTLEMMEGASLKGADFLTNLPSGWQSVQGEDGSYYLQQETAP